MHIILGASGQVGQAVIKNLLKSGEAVKGIVRNAQKATELQSQGAQIAVTDYFDQPALIEAFKDGHTAFVITPETGHSNDVLGDTEKILKNYRAALEKSTIKRVVGLSSMGAHQSKGTGNLLMSYMLEHAFEGVDIETVFLRPAYYFSNWLLYLDTVRQTGVLPTFFPVDFRIPMVSPMDVAEEATRLLISTPANGAVYQLYESAYSSADVAQAFATALNRDVVAESIPSDQWKKKLLDVGFTEDATKNFVEMTQAVIDGSANANAQPVNSLRGKTSLSKYISESVGNQNV